MKLLRVGEKNKEIPAILDKENKIRNLSNYVNDLNPKTLNQNLLDKINDLDLKTLPEIDLKLSNQIIECINDVTNINEVQNDNELNCNKIYHLLTDQKQFTIQNTLF